MTRSFASGAREARGSRQGRDHLAGLCNRRAEPSARPCQASASYELPAQQPPAWYSTARRAQVVRRDSGYAAVLDQGEIALGATYPTVEWVLKQRMFSLEDALARHASVDPSELRGVLAQLIVAGVIVETEMRSDTPLGRRPHPHQVLAHDVEPDPALPPHRFAFQRGDLIELVDLHPLMLVRDRLSTNVIATKR